MTTTAALAIEPTEITAADPVETAFLADTHGYTMTVLHADGLYRHLRFARERGAFYWFDLVTWPGTLVVNGGMGTYVFADTGDMFPFFRHPMINPGYWSQKVRGEHFPLRAYSDRMLRATMAGQLDAYRDALARAMTDMEVNDRMTALRAAVDAYFFGELAEWNVEYESDSAAALEDFEFDPGTGSAEDVFRFEGWEDWDVTDWSYHYLWCCYAIVWGIARWDDARTSVAPAKLAAAPAQWPDGTGPEPSVAVPFTWAEWTWPGWVPVPVRESIEEFWADKYGRGPRAWVRSGADDYAPEFGAIVTQVQGGTNTRVTGRFVHAWGNMGRVVHPDGTFHYTSFSGQGAQ